MIVVVDQIAGPADLTRSALRTSERLLRGSARRGLARKATLRRGGETGCNIAGVPDTFRSVGVVRVRERRRAAELDRVTHAAGWHRSAEAAS